jgi:hypothetical protein
MAVTVSDRATFGSRRIGKRQLYLPLINRQKSHGYGQPPAKGWATAPERAPGPADGKSTTHRKLFARAFEKAGDACRLVRHGRDPADIVEALLDQA